MQGNQDNEDNNLTTAGRNEGGEEDTAREMQAIYRSMQTQARGALAPLAGFGFTGSGVPKANLEGARAPSRNGRWVFQYAQPIPFFPLTNAIVIMYSPHIVAARLYDSLRLRSVDTQYDGSTAICTTSSYLTYSINLYDDKEGNTMMEIIRIDGCGFAFRREREAVVAAAQGKGGIPPSNLPVMLKIPENLLKDFKAPTEREHEDTLMRASDQLHSDKFEVQLFVLRNLSAITCSDKVNQESAQIMSRLIMKNSSNVQELIVSILRSCLEDYNDRNVQMINSCLSIFCNALSLLSDLKLLENFLLEDESSDDYVNEVIPLLIKVVSNCKCPHNACLALRCLCLLYNNSTIAQDVLGDESQKYVTEAEKFGKQKHMKLEKEAQALLAALG